MRYYLMMQHQPIVKRVNGTHEWAHRPYQRRITAAYTNTCGKMKGSHSRAADRCPFVHRHSLSQVTSFMQLGMLLTNCRILSQEICLSGSQYYKCSLFVSGWRHTVSLSSQMDLARLLKPCEVIGGNADCWTSMTNGWPPCFNINPVSPINYWWIWVPLQGIKISIGAHTGIGSTMINIPLHVKIDAQEWFYYMVLPVGGTLIDLTVSMKAKLELYTDAQGTLIFDKYDECSPKNHGRTHRVG